MNSETQLKKKTKKKPSSILDSPALCSMCSCQEQLAIGHQHKFTKVELLLAEPLHVLILHP